MQQRIAPSISKLKNVIPRGQANAISTVDLMEAAGYGDIRKLRRDIRRLRVQGEVILSSTKKGGGYYRPQDTGEVRRFIKQEENRAKSIFYALKTARKLLQQSEDHIQLSFQQNAITGNVHREEAQR